MKPHEMIPLCHGRSDFVDRWKDSCMGSQREEDEWIACLRRNGIKAAHPDDGWVDRERNRVTFCYPQFDDGIQIGDKIALGWPDKWRIVRIIHTTVSLLGLIHWHFEDEVPPKICF